MTDSTVERLSEKEKQIIAKKNWRNFWDDAEAGKFD